MKNILSASFNSLALVPGLLRKFSHLFPSGHDLERNSSPSKAEVAESSPPPGDFLMDRTLFTPEACFWPGDLGVLQ